MYQTSYVRPGILCPGIYNATFLMAWVWNFCVHAIFNQGQVPLLAACDPFCAGQEMACSVLEATCFVVIANIVSHFVYRMIDLKDSSTQTLVVKLVIADPDLSFPRRLGYICGWTTLENLHETAKEHYRREDPLSRSGVAGISFKFEFGFGARGWGSDFRAGSVFGKSWHSGLIRTEKGLGEIREKVKRGTGIDPVKVLAHDARVVMNGNRGVNGEKEKEE
ncbi:hypothetical protein K435DRAFT_793308 [Dendrothele bispora CBS 962.96]|uniref:Uncharacterized protein n=1 Tax=Dendrothele bispora (strain CBS 962.96) TaxID=1314807 RepID=A0A4S8MFW2_DENBC|nr:hypothetical protein K435DRAFT_793308 [Dendrothele bispora CBS 962.96]